MARTQLHPISKELFYAHVQSDERMPDGFHRFVLMATDEGGATWEDRATERLLVKGHDGSGYWYAMVDPEDR